MLRRGQLHTGDQQCRKRSSTFVKCIASPPTHTHTPAPAGRGGNQWTSPDGCLMFTAGRRLKVPGSQAPFINYVVCLAVVRGIADACAPWLGVRDSALGAPGLHC